MSKLPEGTVAAFNQWQSDYIDNPEKFKTEWASIRGFLSTPVGETPSYGQDCVAYLERLLPAQEATFDNSTQPASQPASA